MHQSVALLVLLGWIQSANGHGYLLEPPGRSSMWRVGFATPINYNDNQLYCGGVQNQYTYQGGRCGICGDPYQGPRDNEAGGKYATGIISRKYTRGQLVQLTAMITANHRGWFEFKLCPNNNPQRAATQECLDRHVLQMADGSGSKLYIGARRGKINVKVRLPADVTCTQCVLQWRYHAGNSYGQSKNGTVCKGCGNQEEFYSCSDISISSTGQGGNSVGQGGAVIGQGGAVMGQGGNNMGQGGASIWQGGAGAGQGGANSGQGGANSGQGGANYGQAGANSGQGGANYGQPGANYGQPGTNYGQPGTNHGQPGDNYGQPGTNHGQAGNNYGQPGTNYGQPGTSYGQPGGSRCVAISPLWRGDPQMDSWCQTMCRSPQSCPQAFCACA